MMVKDIDWTAMFNNPECDGLFKYLIGLNEKRIAATDRVHGREADAIRIFKELWTHEREFKNLFEMYRIPADPEVDTVVFEMGFQFGRADIVIFHVDGSATVIEVKNGAHGYGPTVSGIGQAGLYASQLATRNSGITKVRKCLLWTSTGDIKMDAAIARACAVSNTHFFLFDTLRNSLTREAAIVEAMNQVAKALSDV